eukprot:g6818.t1
MSTRVCASGPVDGGCNGASGNDAVDGVTCSSTLSSFSESASNMYTSAELSSSHWSVGVARVVDLVAFWDRRGGSAVSSDVVGAGAVVTFLCCPAVSGPALAMTGVWYSLPVSVGKTRQRQSWCDAWSLCRVKIVFIISGRSSLEVIVP